MYVIFNDFKEHGYIKSKATQPVITDIKMADIRNGVWNINKTRF